MSVKQKWKDKIILEIEKLCDHQYGKVEIIVVKGQVLRVSTTYHFQDEAEGKVN